MLQFFRKYQRFFFTVVAVVVIASFCFFGTSGVTRFSMRTKEHKIGTRLDGSTMTRESVDRMVQFLSRSHLDFFDDRAPAPNWLNEGIVEGEFLQTDLGLAIGKSLGNKMERDLAEAVQTIEQFTPYRHPRSPSLNTEALWKKFVPGSVELVQQVKMTQDIEERFAILSHLCVQQRRFPSHFCKRMLLMQEKQERNLLVDEGIPHADVSLTGLHTLQEFIGPTYLQAVAQVIMQGAAKARAMGMQVSTQDVRMQLLQHVQEAAVRTGKEIPAEQYYPIFVQIVQNMGMEEADCIALYRDIMLFRKYLSCGADVTALPECFAQEFSGFANEQAHISMHTLPPDLMCKDVYELLQLQAYIDAISLPQKRAHLLSFPKTFLSLEEVEKKMSGLVQRNCQLTCAILDVKQESSLVGTKEMWAWEVSDEGWACLVKEYPSLQNNLPAEERFATLDAVSEDMRSKIDRFAKEQMVVSDLALVREKLNAKEKIEMMCSFGTKGEGLPWKELRDKGTLAKLLYAAKTDPVAAERLSFYTEDGKMFYAFCVEHIDEMPRVITFAEAKKAGVVKAYVDRKLEAFYPEVRKKNSLAYLRKDGSWEPLSAVREQVGMAMARDLCLSIQDAYAQYYGHASTEAEKNSSLFYAHHRMLIPLQEAMHEEVAVEETSLLSQWHMQREERVVTRGQKELFASQDSFAIMPGELSPVLIEQQGFFRMIAKDSAEQVVKKDLYHMEALLRQEAQTCMMQDLLQNILDQGGFVL